jgi:hypothetical protein
MVPFSGKGKAVSTLLGSLKRALNHWYSDPVTYLFRVPNDGQSSEMQGF